MNAAITASTAVASLPGSGELTSQVKPRAARSHSLAVAFTEPFVSAEGAPMSISALSTTGLLQFISSSSIAEPIQGFNTLPKVQQMVEVQPAAPG